MATVTTNYTDRSLRGFKDLVSKDSEFSDPFLLPSSFRMPKSREEALDMCVFLYHMNPQYVQATRRVFAHFITRLESGDTKHDDQEVTKRVSYLRDDLNIFQHMHDIGDDWGCYGISVQRIHFPFRRFLEDRREGRTAFWSLSTFPEEHIKYHWKTLEYEVPDPRQKGVDMARRKPVKMKFIDRPDTDEKRVKLRSLDPHRIVFQTSTVSGLSRVIWRIDEQLSSEVKAGRLYQVNETPLSMLETIAKDEDYLFYPDEIFVFRGSSLAGISDDGWPVPPVIQNFRSLYQLQIYRKIDEAVAKDYMLPFRVFSPPANDNPAGSSVHLTNLMAWKSATEEIIKRRRMDETAIFASPFAMEFNEYGGEGKNLAPKELVQYQTNDMLDGFGYPAELFRGSLTVQQMPPAIRLFESSFYFVHRGLNDYLRWISRKCEENFSWNKVALKLTSPTVANDMEARQLLVQLSAGGEISRQRALELMGVEDAVVEKVRRIREDMRIEEETQKAQAEFQRKQTIGSIDNIVSEQRAQQEQAAAQGGAAPGQAPGAAPAGGSSGGIVTPMDNSGKADEEAARLLQMRDQDEGAYNKALRDLKATNPDMHALVKQKIDERRASAESQGRAQVGQMP
jgi:hypothetical protein